MFIFLICAKGGMHTLELASYLSVAIAVVYLSAPSVLRSIGIDNSYVLLLVFILEIFIAGIIAGSTEPNMYREVVKRLTFILTTLASVVYVFILYFFMTVSGGNPLNIYFFVFIGGFILAVSASVFVLSLFGAYVGFALIRKYYPQRIHVPTEPADPLATYIASL